MPNPLESFKKLPTWGKVGVVAGSGVAVFVLWRAHSSAAAAGTATAAGSSGFSAGAGAGAGDGTVTGTGYTDDSGDSGEGSGVAVSTLYSDNEAWASAAQAGLVEIGFDEQAVATALGDYLAGRPLSTSEATIVYAAKAEFSAQGLTLPPVVLAGKGPTGSGDTTPTVSGGHVVSLSNNEAVVGWTGANAKSYRVTITGPGPINGKQSTVSTAQATYGGLEAGHNYTVSVIPVGSTGKAGSAGKITFKTTGGTKAAPKKGK